MDAVSPAPPAAVPVDGCLLRDWARARSLSPAAFVGDAFAIMAERDDDPICPETRYHQRMVDPHSGARRRFAASAAQIGAFGFGEVFKALSQFRSADEVLDLHSRLPHLGRAGIITPVEERALSLFLEFGMGFVAAYRGRLGS